MKKEKLINILYWVLIAIFGIQLVFYIFVASKSLINSDSWFIVDYALEAIKTGTLFPKTWNNSNDFWIYSLIPLITCFLKLGFSLLMSRQMSVFIQTILLILLTIRFVKRQINVKSGVLIIMLLLLSGISGQFMFEVYGDGTYGSIILYMLLELYLFIKYYETKRFDLLLFLE